MTFCIGGRGAAETRLLPQGGVVPGGANPHPAYGSFRIGGSNLLRELGRRLECIAASFILEKVQRTQPSCLEMPPRHFVSRGGWDSAGPEVAISSQGRAVGYGSRNWDRSAALIPGSF